MALKGLRSIHGIQDNTKMMSSCIVLPYMFRCISGVPAVGLGHTRSRKNSLLFFQIRTAVTRGSDQDQGVESQEVELQEADHRLVASMYSLSCVN